MTLKVSESAIVAYYRRKLELLGPSRAPLDPSGGKADELEGAEYVGKRAVEAVRCRAFPSKREK